MSTVPLTEAKRGSTRCVHCYRKFAETPDMPVVEIVTEEPLRNRYGGFSGPQGTRAVRRRWHEQCRDEMDEHNRQSAADTRAQHEQDMRDLCASLELDYDEQVALQAQRRAEAGL